MGMVGCLDQRVEKELDDYDKFADQEKLEGNQLGWKFLDRLNAIDEVPSCNHIRKATEFGHLAGQMLVHICKSDETEAKYTHTGHAFLKAFEPRFQSLANLHAVNGNGVKPECRIPDSYCSVHSAS